MVFLGSRALGRFALEFLTGRPDIELVGKVTLDDYSAAYWDQDPSDLHFPPDIALEDLKHLDFDLGISVNYWKLVSAEILDRASIGFFNIHHSYNLSYRGLNMNTLAIIRARETGQWYHGTTLHEMAETFDSGSIVASYACPIHETDTARSLFSRVEALSRQMIVDWFPRLWSGKIVRTTPGADYVYFSRRDMVSKRLDPAWSMLKIYDYVRALDFEPFEPAYVEDETGRTYLTTRIEVADSLYGDAGEGRRVFVRS